MGCCASLPPDRKGQPKISPNQIMSKLQSADGMFKQQRYYQAIPSYQRIIQSSLNVDYKIEGLGNEAQTIGYYQWFISRWYFNSIQHKRINGTPYDALSLCFAALKNDENTIDEGITWYRRMKRKGDNYKVVFGLGNILFKKGYQDDALRSYNKVIEMQPNFIPALECKALLYEYKFQDKKKSVQVANHLLIKDPNNLWGLFIVARNQKTPQQKIKQLQQITRKHPQYVRAVNQIGIVYGGELKQYDQAIKWYTKCTEIVPQYASCYNNVGVNYEMKKEYQIALSWYFKAMGKDQDYKAPHQNAINLFDRLKWSEEKVLAEMKKYPGIGTFFFYYNQGLAYSAKKQHQTAIKWYKKALQINHEQQYKVHCSMGVALEQLQQPKEAQHHYQKSINLNPKYHEAYYNMAILCQSNKKEDQAIEWYHKTIEVNPHYSNAYNNLGNIHKGRGQLEEACKCYSKAIQYRSTNSLAYANWGICLTIMGKHQDGLLVFQNAKETLPLDKNLSDKNRKFLETTLGNLEKKRQEVQKVGRVTPEQRKYIDAMIRSVQDNFMSAFSGCSVMKVMDQRVLKKQVLQIVNQVHSDQFQLDNQPKLYPYLRKLFFYNQDYFHILPQLFIQYFWKHHTQTPTLTIQKAIAESILRLTQQQSKHHKNKQPQYNEQINLQYAKYDGKKINLFTKHVYFNDYRALCNEIQTVHAQAKQSFKQFQGLVEQIKVQSSGTIYGVNMKIPQHSEDKFRAFLRILQKMFKKQLTPERVKSIIEKIESQLKVSGEKGQYSVAHVIHLIIKVWTEQVTDILQTRKKNKVETQCFISDLLRGKLFYNTVDDLLEAVEITDEMCHKKGYKIVDFDNRVNKPETRDVVFKIKIKEAVCELQLAIKQDLQQYHLIHSLYELERSPLGAVFASYLFMTKPISYPLLVNCKDIVDRLQNKNDPNDKQTVNAAAYIVKQLEINSSQSSS